MNDLTAELNEMMGTFEGDWKLESMYPFIYRGYNGENVIGIILSHLQSGFTDVVIFHSRVDSKTKVILENNSAKTEYLISLIRRYLGHELRKKIPYDKRIKTTVAL